MMALPKDSDSTTLTGIFNSLEQSKLISIQECSRMEIEKDWDNIMLMINLTLTEEKLIGLQMDSVWNFSLKKMGVLIIILEILKKASIMERDGFLILEVDKSKLELFRKMNSFQDKML